MPGARLLGLLMVVGTALGSARARAAPSASASVELGGGHDDNMFLAAAPVASDPLLRLGGWFAAVSPALVGALGGSGWRLEASLLGDYRTAEPVGQLYHHLGELGLALPALGPLRADLGVSAGRFDSTAFPEDRFVFVGGGGGLRLALGEDWHLAGRYRLQLRRLGTVTTSQDQLSAVEANLLWRPRPTLELGPGGSFLIVSGGQSQDGFQRLRGGLEATFAHGPVSLSAAAWGGTVALGSDIERHLGGQLEVRLSVGGHFDLVAAAEIAEPVSAGATRDYARRVFSLGLAASASHVWRRRPVPVEDDRPVVKPGRVRFRLRAPAAAEVSVVGSWDDWQTPGRALSAAGEPTLYETWLDLPGGSYRYHFLVNGQPRRPPDAPRYAADGFGGEDGVVELSTAQAGTSDPPAQEDTAVSSGGGRRISTKSEQ